MEEGPEPQEPQQGANAKKHLLSVAWIAFLLTLVFVGLSAGAGIKHPLRYTGLSTLTYLFASLTIYGFLASGAGDLQDKKIAPTMSLLLFLVCVLAVLVNMLCFMNFVALFARDSPERVLLPNIVFGVFGLALYVLCVAFSHGEPSDA